MEQKKGKLGWRIVKWTGISLLSLAILLTAGIYLMRDKIVNEVVASINSKLQTPVSVKDFDLTFWASFPNMSVDFNEVYIQEHAPEGVLKDTLFYSQCVRLKFNPFDIIDGKYNVKGVQVFPGKAKIQTFADGTQNYEMVKADTTSNTESFKFELEKIEFNNFDLAYVNEKEKQQYFTTLESTSLKGSFSDAIYNLNVQSQVVLHKIQTGELAVINEKSAQWDISLLVDKVNDKITIAQAPITVANLPFVVNLLSEKNRVDLRIAGNQIQLADFAKNVQHEEAERISDLKGNGIVEFDLHFLKDSIDVPNLLTCSFGVENGQIEEQESHLKIANINLKGNYTNQDAQRGEHVQVDHVSFSTAGSKFQGTAVLDQFDRLRIRGNANGKVNLGVLNTIFPFPGVQSVSGTVDVAGDFNVRKQNSTWDIAKCDGTADFYKTQFQLKGDKRYFDHIQGRVELKGDKISMKKLNMVVGKSDLRLDGQIAFLDGLFNTSGDIYTDLNITSAYMNVQDFSSNTKEEEIKDGRNYILPENVRGAVHMVANNLVYEKHSFKRLRTDMEVGLRSLTFRNLHLNNAQADIVGEAQIAENTPEVFTITTNASSNNIKFAPLFKEWDNFDQSVLTAQHISGNAAMNLAFSAPFDLRTGIKHKEIEARAKIRVENGRLKNVSTFKEITQSLQSSAATRLVLKSNNITDFESQLADLKFENFENELIIKDGMLSIPQMTIVSNAMTINLSGDHSFENEIDYHFNFNFREIRKVREQTEFGDVMDDGTGIQLFVRMYGNLDDPSIEWDHEQSRAIAKANFKEEKQTAKSILKSEFGMFANDKSVETFQAKKVIKEEVKVMFNEDKKEEEAIKTKPKKKGRFGKALQKWKEEAEKESEEEFVIEP